MDKQADKQACPLLSKEHVIKIEDNVGENRQDTFEYMSGCDEHC